jgi:hypothetical protein
MTIGLINLMLLAHVETARLHFLGESNKVWWAVEVPLLVSPEGSSDGTASLNLVNDHANSHIVS